MSAEKYVPSSVGVLTIIPPQDEPREYWHHQREMLAQWCHLPARRDKESLLKHCDGIRYVIENLRNHVALDLGYAAYTCSFLEVEKCTKCLLYLEYVAREIQELVCVVLAASHDFVPTEYELFIDVIQGKSFEDAAYQPYLRMKAKRQHEESRAVWGLNARAGTSVASSYYLDLWSSPKYREYMTAYSDDNPVSEGMCDCKDSIIGNRGYNYRCGKCGAQWSDLEERMRKTKNVNQGTKLSFAGVISPRVQIAQLREEMCDKGESIK